MQEYGCEGCHEIPGIPGASARRWATSPRAGATPNQPTNPIAWIQDPPAVDSFTAMPNVGLKPLAGARRRRLSLHALPLKGERFEQETQRRGETSARVP
jgi:hypothetical protein